MSRRAFWEFEPRVDVEQVAGWTLPAILLERAIREGERTVYRVPSNPGFRDVTWREMAASVSAIAVGLSCIGVSRGDRVAIMGDASLDWVLCDFGVMAAGGITLGIYQTSSSPEISHILDDARPRIVIVQRREHLIAALGAVGNNYSVEKFVLIEGDPTELNEKRGGFEILTLQSLRELGENVLLESPNRAHELVAEGSPQDIARIIYTSGTTGRPKGATYTHQAWLLPGEQWVLRYPAIRWHEHRTVALLSLSHVSAAILVIVVPLLTRLVPHFGVAGATLLDMFMRVRPEVIGMTPRFFQKIAVQLVVTGESGSVLGRWLYHRAMHVGNRVVRAHWNGEESSTISRLLLWVARRTIFRRLLSTVGLEQVRRAQTGSAVMPTEVAVLWAIWGVDVREAYGLTEAACAVAYQVTPFPRPGTIGRLMTPQPGTELRLAPDGEILFKSPMTFSGYWKNPEATADVIRDGWVYTGDLAEWTPHGDLRLIGRKNDAISTAGGKTINPTEIENEVKLSPYISEAIVFGHGEKYLTALIELEMETVGAWARSRGMVWNSLAALSAIPDVVNLIDREVKRANESIGRVQQIKKFTILPETLDSIPDALTSARKVRRRVVKERFHNLIEEMYDRSENDLLSMQVKQFGSRSVN